MIARLRSAVLGVHPRNTVFSFNWHNVRHINHFLKAQAASINTTGLSVADVGGGNSPYFDYFSHLSSSYQSVDLNQSRHKTDKRSIIFLEGVAEDIPLESESIDLVLCNQVLEHVIDPVKSVAEIHRILKLGGRFIGSVPHISPVHLEPYDFRRYTDLGVFQLLDNQGFERIETSGNGGIFSASAFAIWMDILLSNRKKNKPQGFRSNLALLVSPLVAISNISSLILDKLLSQGNRSPANLCWSAIKQEASEQSK